MNKLDYDYVDKELNNIINLNQEFYLNLLKKMIEKPERFIDTLSISNKREQISANIAISKKIKFGYFLENLFQRIFTSFGFEILPNKINNYKNSSKVDILMKKENTIFLIEQKVRDDHDNSKKVGQIQNYFEKINAIRNVYPNYNIKSYFWFISEWFTKNRNYYQNKIKEFNDDNKWQQSFLVYAHELFATLLEDTKIWSNILEYISKQRQKHIENDNVDHLLKLKENINNLTSSLKSKIYSDKLQYRLLRKFLEMED